MDSGPSGAAAPRRPTGKDAELKREAETLRRLADQLEALADEPRELYGGFDGRVDRRKGRSVPVPESARDPDAGELSQAAGREPLTVAEAEALRELPGRLENAVRRLRLSSEILSHHLGTLSTLVHKAAGLRTVTGSTASRQRDQATRSPGRLSCQTVGGSRQ